MFKEIDNVIGERLVSPGIESELVETLRKAVVVVKQRIERKER